MHIEIALRVVGMIVSESLVDKLSSQGTASNPNGDHVSEGLAHGVRVLLVSDLLGKLSDPLEDFLGLLVNLLGPLRGSRECFLGPDHRVEDGPFLGGVDHFPLVKALDLGLDVLIKDLLEIP